LVGWLVGWFERTRLDHSFALVQLEKARTPPLPPLPP
jgi:hypothetical protein